MRSKVWHELRELAKVGIVNHKHDTELLIRAADRGEELEERCFDLEERLAIETETSGACRPVSAAPKTDDDFWADDGPDFLTV